MKAKLLVYLVGIDGKTILQNYSFEVSGSNPKALIKEAKRIVQSRGLGKIKSISPAPGGILRAYVGEST